MSKLLTEASSLFNIIKHTKNHDCSNFFKHLTDRGVELLCRIISYILRGDFIIADKVRGKLRKKIKNYMLQFKRLATPPSNNKDIAVKRKILQRGGIIGALTAIASVVVPLIAQLIAARKK